MLGCVPTNLGSFLLVSLFAVSVFASGIHTFAVFSSGMPEGMRCAYGFLFARRLFSSLESCGLPLSS
jgi:hypothetical protein